MTRRFPPTSITVGHADAQLADWQRQAARPHFVAEPVAPAPVPEPPARPKPTRQVTAPLDRPAMSARRGAAPTRAAKPAPSKPTPARGTAADEPDQATIDRVLDFVFNGEK